jgi:hypothetical protein
VDPQWVADLVRGHGCGPNAAGQPPVLRSAGVAC